RRRSRCCRRSGCSRGSDSRGGGRGWCCTFSDIQEGSSDRPPRLESLEVVHAAPTRENNMAAYGQAGSVDGRIHGNGRRIERAVHWDGRAANPRRRVNVIFCGTYVLVKRVV